MVDENEKSIIIFKCGDGISVVSGLLCDISSPTEEYVENIPQELSTSFEIEVKPNMAEAIEKLFEVKRIEDLKTDDIIIKQKYSQPPYRERLHSKNVDVFSRCRIRNRPNYGHGFKN